MEANSPHYSLYFKNTCPSDHNIIYFFAQPSSWCSKWHHNDTTMMLQQRDICPSSPLTRDGHICPSSPVRVTVVFEAVPVSCRCPTSVFHCMSLVGLLRTFSIMEKKVKTTDLWLVWDIRQMCHFDVDWTTRHIQQVCC